MGIVGRLGEVAITVDTVATSADLDTEVVACSHSLPHLIQVGSLEAADCCCSCPDGSCLGLVEQVDCKLAAGS